MSMKTDELPWETADRQNVRSARHSQGMVMAVRSGVFLEDGVRQTRGGKDLDLEAAQVAARTEHRSAVRSRGCPRRPTRREPALRHGQALAAPRQLQTPRNPKSRPRVVAHLRTDNPTFATRSIES